MVRVSLRNRVRVRGHGHGLRLESALGDRLRVRDYG